MYLSDDSSDSGIVTARGLRIKTADNSVLSFRQSPPKEIHVGSGYKFTTLSDVAAYIQTMPEGPVSIYVHESTQSAVQFSNRELYLYLYTDLLELTFANCPFVRVMAQGHSITNVICSNLQYGQLYNTQMDTLGAHNSNLFLYVCDMEVKFSAYSGSSVFCNQCYVANGEVEAVFSSIYCDDDTSFRSCQLTAANSGRIRAKASTLKSSLLSPAENTVGNYNSIIVTT